MAILDTLRVAPVTKLTHAVETVSEVVVAECVANTELLLQRDTDLELMLSACICDDLPVVLAVHKWSIGHHRPEEVIRLMEECMSTIS